MNRILFYVVLYSYILCSCTKRDVKEVLLLKTNDTLSVTIDYPLLSSYSKLVAYDADNELYAVGYNRFLHSLDFVNLFGGANRSIKLKKEGPDATLPPVSFSFITDSIIWADAGGVSILSMGGVVLDRLERKELAYPVDKYSISPQGVSNPLYTYLNTCGKNIYIPLASIVDSGELFIGKIFDVQKNSLDFIPLAYPQKLLKKSIFFGGLAFPNIQEYNGLLVYNFPCSSLVYVYDIETDNLEILKLNSTTIQNELGDGIDMNMPPRKRFEMESMSARFDKVYYSSHLNRFYRIHYKGKERLFDMNNAVYLMSCDREGENVREYQLPFSASQQYIIHNDVLYYTLKTEKEDVFLYSKIDLSIL